MLSSEGPVLTRIASSEDLMLVRYAAASAYAAQALRTHNAGPEGNLRFSELAGSDSGGAVRITDVVQSMALPFWGKVVFKHHLKSNTPSKSCAL